MKENEVYESLAKQAPVGYRINELIRFSYPVRKVRIKALVNKLPDESLIKIYNVLLRSIDHGFRDNSSLFEFLGILQTDEFILRELFALRAKGMLDLVSENWCLTEEGKHFIEDNKILRVEESEEYEFLVDAITGKVFPQLSLVVKGNKEEGEKYLAKTLSLPEKSPELLKGKYQELCDAYKQESKGTAYLINYDEKDILSDKESWIDYWFIEYIKKDDDDDPYLEVRNIDSLEKNDLLTKKFNNEYWQYVVQFTDSERKDADVVKEVEHLETRKTESSAQTSAPIVELTIWETKQKFIESLRNVKEQILIESPWIKRATREYLPYFKELLECGKKLIILYGIDENSEHDSKTMRELETLQKENVSNFYLIDLSEHLRGSHQKFSGTHRKLLIKDNDYYISGSFNFLSFAKQEGQRIANEESQLITQDVTKKWERVIKEYNLPFKPPSGKIVNNNNNNKVDVSEDVLPKKISVESGKSKKNAQTFVPNDNRALSFNMNEDNKTNSTGVNRLTKKQ